MFDLLFHVSLESTLLALQSPEDVQELELSPGMAENYRQLSTYRDLLMLGDLPTITQVLLAIPCCSTVSTRTLCPGEEDL